MHTQSPTYLHTDNTSIIVETVQKCNRSALQKGSKSNLYAGKNQNNNNSIGIGQFQ